MLYTLFEIIISALAVYGGWRLIHDVSAFITYRMKKREADGDNNDASRKKTDGQNDTSSRQGRSDRD